MPTGAARGDPTALPTPWYAIREHLAKEWHLPPWDVDAPELGDEVGRWLEYRRLEAEYAPPAGGPQRGTDED